MIPLLPCRIPLHCGVWLIKSEQKRKGNTSHPPPLCPAAWRGVFAQQNIGESRGAWRQEEVIKRPSVEIIEVTLLSLCVPERNIGGVPEGRGLKRLAKARAKSPPLSVGEVARKTEEKGRGLSERSEFHRPRRRP